MRQSFQSLPRASSASGSPQPQPFKAEQTTGGVPCSASVQFCFRAPGVLSRCEAARSVEPEMPPPLDRAEAAEDPYTSEPSYEDMVRALRERHVAALLDSVPQEHRAALAIQLYAPDTDLGDSLPSPDEIADALECWRDLILDDLDQHEDSFFPVPYWVQSFDGEASYQHETHEQAHDTRVRVRALLPDNYIVSTQYSSNRWYVYAGPPCCAQASKLLTTACGRPVSVVDLPRVVATIYEQYRALYRALGAETGLDREGALDAVGIRWRDRITQAADPGRMLCDHWAAIVRDHNAYSEDDSDSENADDVEREVEAV